MPRSQRPRGRGRRKAETPHPIDVHVGMRVRERRAELGISQERLAAELGLTFQQVQKYERAANRISASRLYHMSKVLDVKPAFFYDGYQEAEAHRGFAEPPAETFDFNPMRRREAIELIKAFWSIEKPELRATLLRLARSFAEGGKLE
jgi:transcriptional regulator with XRE-family HTH domain